MNPYFVCFAIAAVLIAPLTVAVDAELGRRTRYRLRLLAAGLPMRRQYLRVLFSRRRVLVEERGLFTAKSEERALALPKVNAAIVRTLLSPKLWRCLLGGVKLERLMIRVALRDASRTALVYAAVATVLRSLNEAGKLPPTAGVSADFSGESTRLYASCIISVRTGRLLLTTATAGVLLLRALAAAKERTKEQSYAASH